MRNLFATRQEAIQYLNNVTYLKAFHKNGWMERGSYILSHGEYDRPTYSVRKYKDGYAVRGEYFYYRGTCYAPHDGRLEDLSIFNV